MKLELRSIDRHYATFICRESDYDSPELWCCAALVSHAVGEGHICLNLEEIAGRELLLLDKVYQLPPLPQLITLLKSAAAVGAPGDFRPLLLDRAARLYLHRYWNYESELVRGVREKAGSAQSVDQEILRGGLARLFPASDRECDWQAVAAMAALFKRFCIISGGPGTGKTSTVVKILALLLEQQQETPQRIAMAAPTGKAAARLKESISRMKNSLDSPAAIREQIPTAVTTIHRLLGSIHGSVRFRFSADNPLPHDVVIIDEASMVDLPLMAKLVQALKPEARLILLGDRDQLASVEAGAVLGDLCGNGREVPFSPRFSQLVTGMTGAQLPTAGTTPAASLLTDTLVVLKKNYRFRSASGLATLAETINGGRASQALQLLQEEDSPQIAWHDIPEAANLKKALAPRIVEGYRHYLAAATPREALEKFDQFRVLCAVRQGPYGVEALNLLVERILAEQGVIDPRQRWYTGRPVMITANDDSCKLFNGDVGIVFPDPEADQAPKVYFPLADGGVRKVSPLRLPPHETVYAMTIHKSQGSEFNTVLMLLPNRDTPLLSRELLYTGITRAVSGCTVWGNSEVFTAAVKRKVVRRSGLSEALWGER